MGFIDAKQVLISTNKVVTVTASLDLFSKIFYISTNHNFIYEDRLYNILIYILKLIISL